MIIQEMKIKFHNFRIEKLNIKKLTHGNQPSVLGQPSLVQSYLQVQYTSQTSCNPSAHMM